MKNTSFSTDAPTGPLSGLKVLELGQLIAGPFAAKTLADFGADVIKIEPPGMGDPLRKWRLLKDGTSVWWQVQSRNKRSVAVDLRQPEGQDIVRQLAREADVLLESFRPGVMDRLAQLDGIAVANREVAEAARLLAVQASARGDELRLVADRVEEKVDDLAGRLEACGQCTPIQRQRGTP